MVTATLTKTKTTLYGQMNFYKLETPIEVSSPFFETRLIVDYVAVSSVELSNPIVRTLDRLLDPVMGTDSSSGTETMIFPCDEYGEVVDYGEGLARFNPMIPDAEALCSLGIEIQNEQHGLGSCGDY